MIAALVAHKDSHAGLLLTDGTTAGEARSKKKKKKKRRRLMTRYAVRRSPLLPSTVFYFDVMPILRAHRRPQGVAALESARDERRAAQGGVRGARVAAGERDAGGDHQGVCNVCVVFVCVKFFWDLMSAERSPSHGDKQEMEKEVAKAEGNEDIYLIEG